MKTTKKTAVLMLTAILLLSFLTSLTSLPACAAPRKEYSSHTFEYFDTFSSFTAFAKSEKDFEKYEEIFNSNMELYHRLLDIYNEYSSLTNLCTLNLSAGEGEVAVSEELFDFLTEAKRLYTLTDGYTNITMGAVTSLWHEARESTSPAYGIPPSDKALEEAGKHTDIDSLLLDGERLTVTLTDPLMSLDGGALAKGYVCDRLSEKLQEAGCDSFLINLGGNVISHGTNYRQRARTGDTSWLSGIDDPFAYFDERPENMQKLPQSVNISDRTLVTSGSYQRLFVYEGRLYHHIISKDTLGPENLYVSVTVLSKSSAEADALSTALFSMTEADGLSLVEALPHTEVMWIHSDGHVTYSRGFEKFIVK